MHSRLMELLRLRSHIQRLRRCYGEQEALQLLREALEIELDLRSQPVK